MEELELSADDIILHIENPQKPTPMEKEMAHYSSSLAWEIPWTGAWRATVHGVTKGQTRLREEQALARGPGAFDGRACDGRGCG